MVKSVRNPVRAGVVALVGLAVPLLSGCAVVQNIDDPCALANREVSFSVLVENSMANTYNACLADRREDIIAQWGKE